jgi:hypothetical protein
VRRHPSNLRIGDVLVETYLSTILNHHDNVPWLIARDPASRVERPNTSNLLVFDAKDTEVLNVQFLSTVRQISAFGVHFIRVEIHLDLRKKLSGEVGPTRVSIDNRGL